MFAVHLFSCVFAVQLFDKGGKGFITEEELGDILYQAFGMSTAESSKLFAHIVQQEGHAGTSQQDSQRITYGKHIATGQPAHHVR